MEPVSRRTRSKDLEFYEVNKQRQRSSEKETGSANFCAEEVVVVSDSEDEIGIMEEVEESSSYDGSSDDTLSVSDGPIREELNVHSEDEIISVPGSEAEEDSGKSDDLEDEDYHQGEKSESDSSGYDESLQSQRKKLKLGTAQNSVSAESNGTDFEILSSETDVPEARNDHVHKKHGRQFTRRKRIRSLRETERLNILGNSRSRVESKPEEIVDPVVEVPTLPLKFKFGVEESTPADKSEKDKEMEELWGEMGNALHGVDCDATDDEGDVEFSSSRTDFSEYESDDDEYAQKKNGRQSTRNRIHPLRETEVLDILANSMAGDESRCEEIVETVIKEATLPLNFTFGGEESPPVLKPDEYAELWEEMDLELKLLHANDNKTEKAPVEEERNSYIPSVLCDQGKHFMIIDEEIGIICKYCSLVKLEMKHYTEPFAEHTSYYSERRDYREQTNIYDELHNQDSCHYSQTDSNIRMQGTVWNIVPGLENDLHAHQRRGFEFLWENIAGGIYLNKLKESNSSNGEGGCIISHAPGTGKTRLAIVFLHTYMKLYPNSRAVIVAPRSMLLSWEAEFRKWKVDIPFHNLNEYKYSGKEIGAAIELAKSVQHNLNISRWVKLRSWERERSVLGISYKLFEELVGEKEQQRHAEVLRKLLLDRPDLLVLDEGHTARNEGTLIYKALSKVKTEKRIILTGTPFQNNFDELYNLLYFVRPKFIDQHIKYNSFHEKKNPSKKMQDPKWVWFNMTRPIGKDKERSFGKDNQVDERLALDEVKKIISSFVDVHKGDILRERLPGLRDAMVLLNPDRLQKQLLDVQPEGCYFDKDYRMSLVSVHPSLMCKRTFNMLDPSVRLELEKHGLDPDELETHRLDPDVGVKTKFLIELIRLSSAMGEKVLVFSQFKWKGGTEFLHMDGQLDARKRQSLIKNFNNKNSKSKVLLASIKACSEGINLVGASRVVLLDVVWNPSVKRQAISRAYRLGQEKVVFAYHLLTSGTLEEEKYCRQSEKDRISELVFTSSDTQPIPQTMEGSSKGGIFEDRILQQMVQQNKLNHIFNKIAYESEDSNLLDSFE